MNTREAFGSISSAMIVEIRDITSVSPSPEGNFVVVGVCHPNPSTNQRELSWVILSTRETGKPVTIPAGGEISDPKGIGAMLTQRVVWSADGKWFFYLRLDAGEVQLWKSSTDGRDTRQVSYAKSDVLDISPSPEPDKFIVHLGPLRSALRQAVEREYRNGLLYDDHVLGGYPLFRTQPFIDRWQSLRRSDDGTWGPPGWSEGRAFIFDARRATFARYSARGAQDPGVPGAGSKPQSVVAVPLSPMPEDRSEYTGQFTLQIESPSGEGEKCQVAECVANRLTVLGWSRDGSEIYYVADSGLGHGGARFPGRAEIYGWRPRSHAVRLIHDAGGRLYNLESSSGLILVPDLLVASKLYVAFTGADQPPYLESVDLKSGVVQRLFDPNESLRVQTEGRANWIRWDTSGGYPGRGIVVFPDDYRAGTRYPTVLTSYTCGAEFLRGGGLDNAPEFVLAHYGFISVCLDIMITDILARENQDLSRLYPAFCDIVNGLIDKSAISASIDAGHVGLSGQSFGANAGTYCISHSNVIAAAAFRHGSIFERARWDLFDTAAWRRDPTHGVYAKFHMPDPHHDPTGRWAEMSVAERASEVTAPTLFQISDTEFFSALPLWSALRDAGKAVEMYVYPEETHWLRQPAHRLMNYDRQVDWFRYWLKNEVDADSSKAEQYERWNRLRDLTANTLPPP